MLTAMARELVQNKGIGEPADLAWRSLGALRPTNCRQVEEPIPSLGELEDALMNAPASRPLSNSALVQALTSQSHRPGRGAISRQLSLF